MGNEIVIKCRLDELMDSRNITSEKLSIASGVPEMKIDQYRKGTMEIVSMSEIASIMAAMGCRNISELLDVSAQAEAMDSTSKVQSCTRRIGILPAGTPSTESTDGTRIGVCRILSIRNLCVRDASRGWL